MAIKKENFKKLTILASKHYMINPVSHLLSLSVNRSLTDVPQGFSCP